MVRCLYVVATVLLAWSACRTSKLPGAAVVEVRIVDETPPGDHDLTPIDVPELSVKVQNVVRKVSGFALSDDVPRAVPRYRLRLHLARAKLPDLMKQQMVLRSAVAAELVPIPAPAPMNGEPKDPFSALSFEVGVRSEKRIALGDVHTVAAALSLHLERSTIEAAERVTRKLMLGVGEERALVAALGSQDSELREEAMRQVGERRVRKAVPKLISFLKSDDEELRDRAIGALAAIGDERAVRPLTEVAHFRDLSDLPKVLDALSAIGGKEAEAYLEFVASGHESSEMRDIAQTALGHLRRRASTPVSEQANR